MQAFNLQETQGPKCGAGLARANTPALSTYMACLQGFTNYEDLPGQRDRTLEPHPRSCLFEVNRTVVPEQAHSFQYSYSPPPTGEDMVPALATPTRNRVTRGANRPSQCSRPAPPAFTDDLNAAARAPRHDWQGPPRRGPPPPQPQPPCCGPGPKSVQ